MNYTAIFFISLFTAYELFLLKNRHSSESTRNFDRGTLIKFWIILPLSITLAFQAPMIFPKGNIDLGRSLLIIGCSISVFGLFFRWYSIRKLGKWFTVDVSLKDNQILIKDGPYKFIRNPSYTGAILTIVGVGLILSNFLSIFILLFSSIYLFIIRMNAEESALSGKFGSEWDNYCAKSWRLFPPFY